MPDVDTIMKPWTDGDNDGQQQGREMPDFENADLLTVIDEVCGTHISINFKYPKNK